MERSMPRRLPAMVSLSFLVRAGCASVPPHEPAPLSAAGYPADLAQFVKDEDEDEEEGKDRAASPSIEYNLRLEADESGPPTAAQILRAHGERKALLGEARSPGAVPKAAGL